MGDGCEITSDTILSQIGQPLQVHVEMLLKALMGPSMQASGRMLDDLRKQHGYSLVDIINSVWDKVNKIPFQGEPMKQFQLAGTLSDIQFRLNKGCSEQIQGLAFCGAFHAAYNK